MSSVGSIGLGLLRLKWLVNVCSTSSTLNFDHYSFVALVFDFLCSWRIIRSVSFGPLRFCGLRIAFALRQGGMRDLLMRFLHKVLA